MKEGAWINAQTGAWVWITEHASWIQVRANAGGLGMPEAAIERLAVIPWDWNGPGRKAILLEAMAHGFIRVRGHGQDCTFEHTMTQAAAMEAARPFMAQNFGPVTWVRFTNLETGEMIEATYADLLEVLGQTGASRSPAGRG